MYHYEYFYFNFPYKIISTIMKAHIITIGDEILIGQTINTNAAFIGEILTDNQIDVVSTSVVGDEENDILNEFERCYNNNDLIIVTGGLGPTHDDITVQAITKYFKTELIRDEEVLQDVIDRFKKMNRHMVKINEDQALVPKIASVIRNKFGTAPGTWIEKDGKIFVSLPGVPHEMKSMMQNYVIPKLNEGKIVSEFVTVKTNLLTTGIGESTLFEKLGNINDLLDGAKMAFLPSEYGTKLRITTKEKTKEEAFNKLQEIEQKIRSIAGRYIYGINDDELPEVLGRMLIERNLKIAVAESCTGGNIANMLTNFNGSSMYFERGIVSYSNDSKIELLSVKKEDIDEYGAVSEEVATQMANGIKSISNSDIGLAVSGILGPSGGSSEKPVGTVYIAVSFKDSTVCRKYNFGDNRKINKTRATQAALDMVRKQLLGISLVDA
jgi:nicotinamide-nucleotide amidase